MYCWFVFGIRSDLVLEADKTTRRVHETYTTSTLPHAALLCPDLKGTLKTSVNRLKENKVPKFMSAHKISQIQLCESSSPPGSLMASDL